MQTTVKYQKTAKLLLARILTDDPGQREGRPYRRPYPRETGFRKVNVFNYLGLTNL